MSLWNAGTEHSHVVLHPYLGMFNIQFQMKVEVHFSNKPM